MNKHEDLPDKHKDVSKHKSYNPLNAVSKRTYTVLFFLWITIIIVDGIKQYFVNY